MSGPELIEWLVGECGYRKVPPTDSAMIILLRELVDIEAAVKTIRHVKCGYVSEALGHATREG